VTLWGVLVTLRLARRAQVAWTSPMQLAWVSCEQCVGTYWLVLRHAVVGGIPSELNCKLSQWLRLEASLRTTLGKVAVTVVSTRSRWDRPCVSPIAAQSWHKTCKMLLACMLMPFKS